MIIALYVITIFFDAYCFVEIGNRAVTLFYPVSLLPILLTLKKPYHIILGIRRYIPLALLIIYAAFNFAITDSRDFGALSVTLFMWIVFLMTYRKSTYNEFRVISKRNEFDGCIWPISVCRKANRITIHGFLVKGSF